VFTFPKNIKKVKIYFRGSKNNIDSALSIKSDSGFTMSILHTSESSVTKGKGLEFNCTRTFQFDIQASASGRYTNVNIYAIEVIK